MTKNEMMTRRLRTLWMLRAVKLRLPDVPVGQEGCPTSFEISLLSLSPRMRTQISGIVNFICYLSS